ncbi:MAG: capsid protein [Rhodoblastus sp.]
MSANRPFVVSPALTGIAIGYTNPAQTLIADRVLPRTPVAGEKFKWTEFPLAEGFTVPDAKVGRKGRVALVEFSGIEKTESTEDYGFGDLIPNSDIRAAAAARQQGLSNYDPENHAAAWLTNLLLLAREVRVAAVVQNANNYAAGRVTALAGAAKFSDYVNSDPIGIIMAALDSTLVYRPNKMTMGQPVWAKVRQHPKIVNAVKGNLTNQGVVTREQVADLFEIKELIVGESYVNVAQKGQVANLQRTWGNTISLTYIDPQVIPEQGGVTWGFSAQFGTRIAGSIPDSDVGLEGGREIRVGERIKELVVAKDVGALITGVV